MEKVKVRINNSHKHIWAVVWNGQPEDFSDAKDITLIASVRDKRINLTQGIDYVIEGNLVKIDFTPRFCKNTGVYNIELNYTKPSESFLSGERRTAVDLNVIEIVGTSACADATDETSSVSEAAFGFQGLSAYEVWLKDNPDKTKEDYYNWLRQPATDAVSLIDDKIEHLDEVIDSSTENEAERVSAETLRLQSENLRISAETERKANEVERLANEASRASEELIREANESLRKQDEATRKTNENERETAELTRQTSESERNEAEVSRVNAESSRELAESLRVEAEEQRVLAEELRQTNTATAISNAEEATLNANTAAQNANDAREAIQTDLALKANHGYESNPKTLKEVDDLFTQSYAPNINFFRYFPKMERDAIMTNEGLLFLNTSTSHPVWTATIPKFAGKVAIVFDGTVSGIEAPTDKIRFHIQYTGYSAYTEITQNMDGIRVLREVDFNENIANITRIRIYVEGNAQVLVRNMYVGNKDRYNEPTLLQYEIDNPALTVDNLMYLGENKSMLLPNPHDVAAPIRETLDVSKYTTIHFRADISSVGADVNVTNFTIVNADNGLNAINPQPLFRHQGTRGYGYISVNVSSINRLRITASGQGLLHELVASESIMTNKTKAVKSFGVDMLFNKNVKLTHLINDTPVNILPNNGLIKYELYPGSGASFIDDGFVRFTGSSPHLIYLVEPADYERYISVVNAKNITGAPKIGYRTSASDITYFTIIPGASYKLPANRTQIIINASGGSIDIKQIYLGDNPYNEDWVENIPVTEEINHFENVDLNGYENVITDEDDNKVIRIYGDGTKKGVAIRFDKVIENGYFSLQFRTNSEQIEYRTAHIDSNGSVNNIVIYENIKVYPNINHIISEIFSPSFPAGRLSVYFTGSESEYIEILSPAITKNNIDISTKLINKYSSDKKDATGIAEFDIASDILAENPSGLIKVGEYLLSKKKENPTSKLDFECINGVKPSAVSKLQDIRYVDTGDWDLLLITTKKRFIFSNSATNQTKYTDDIDDCLINTEFVGERRFTLDDTKLISMLNKLSRGVRELSDGELVFWTYGTQHYTTDGQTQVHESGVIPSSIGSRMNGWAYDAYDDTVVFSTYSSSPNYGKGSIILSLDGGRTYFESFNVETDGATLLGATATAQCHIHGVFIDQYRNALIALLGDYSFDEVANGKIIVLEDYKNNTQWRLIENNFENIPREQYCTGIALPKANLYGTDMNETCIARQAIGIKGLDTPREWADQLHIGLDYIPNFTRPIEPGAPVGIHYSYIGGANPNVPASSILLTKDGFYFPVIYTDNVAHGSFGNNNARVWCDNSGNVYCTQFGGRFERSIIMGKYNGFNMV